jgi:predicted metal-dependent HD superfamily phosphohydrolase
VTGDRSTGDRSTGDDETALLAAWRLALPPDAPDAVADAIGRDLLARWSERRRRYHTVEHLAFVLDVIEDAAALADDAAAVRLAAWFHDAIYDPIVSGPGANERASADLAAALLPRLTVAPDQTAEVVRLVLLTADHRVEPGDRNGALLADADLAILGTSPDRYRRYVEAARSEYAAFPDDEFAAGRSTVLTKLLDLDPIYRLATHREAWEARARENMRTELAALGD